MYMWGERLQQGSRLVSVELFQQGSRFVCVELAPLCRNLALSAASISRVVPLLRKGEEIELSRSHLSIDLRTHRSFSPFDCKKGTVYYNILGNSLLFFYKSM